MEPTFIADVSKSTVTLGLQALIDAAVAALPDAHKKAPTKGKIVESNEAAFLRL
jgi:hypothetical protein